MSRISWSRDAVIYQIYVRSFADADGDGIGDLLGVASRLDYVRDLAVDAIWLTPFYPSPMADGGYDVADFRGVDPRFGTLADFDKLVMEAHARGLRVIIDLVPNHTSSAHPWFTAAVAAGPGSPERARFHFRPGRGPDGAQPPNNWQSIFGGPAWTRLPDGEWYLHLFASEQPDLNWDHPEVRAEFADILRFWLDRGVDGIRIDVAHGMVKAPGLPDAGAASVELLAGAETPYFDQDGVHEIYREWRSILDSYTPERIAVAEAWLPNVERAARYVRPGELHQAFNFHFLGTPWSAPAYRDVIDTSLAVMGEVGATTTWVLSNHDVVRHASRLAAGIGGTAGGATAGGGPAATADPALGLRRARAAALLMLALPGSAYLYQGEELGLPEVFDLPDECREDPVFVRSGGAELGRDGCRVPLPWSGSSPPYGFGPAGSTPWLPQPESWAVLSVAAQADDPSSTLNLYRRALRLRRERLGGRGVKPGRVEWHSAPGDAHLDFSHIREDGTGVRCVVNLGTEPVPVPEAPRLLASESLPQAGLLPPDTAAWWPC
ncbi:MAG TPA: alpha-amylase family glycosyl hydrolase [Micromonosporaceae bacterium]|nr:alpha-amylase family glycosyl hydrolase [Micromonosporaceae bacterium]